MRFGSLLLVIALASSHAAFAQSRHGGASHAPSSPGATARVGTHVASGRFNSGNGNPGFGGYGSLVTPYPAATSLGGLPLPPGFNAPVGGSTIGIGPGAYNVVGGHNRYGGRSRFAVGVPVFPFYGAPFYGGLPYDSTSYWQDQSQAQAAPVADSNGQDGDRLASEIQRLSNEISQLRDARSQPAGLAEDVGEQNARPQTQVPPQIPVTVVLRNGTRFEAGNYAVMDHTFWDFSGSLPRKIPIASIDVDASVKATEASGGDFPLPISPSR